MTEYIKKSEAIEVLEFYESIGAYHDFRLKESMENIEPTDVVEVVRCKDCKHWIRAGIYGSLCKRGRYGVNDNGYCDEGKRRKP